MKKLQNNSSDFLGVKDFYVSAFDVSARIAIQNGNSGLQSLESVMSKRSIRNQKFDDFTAIDLGANIGRYSIFFASLYSKVIAIEAHPLTFRLLSLNTETFPNIQCENIAVSDSSEGFAEIKEFGPLESPRASIDPSDEGRIPFRSFKVSKVTLDRLIQHEQNRVGLIKIDVEGHDLQALLGAEKTIRKFQPDIVFEYNVASPELLLTLSDFGYKTFFAPNTEILAKFNSKKAMLQWCLARRRPIQEFRKLYSKASVFEFTALDLPLSELVMALPTPNTSLTP
jgi:FkbM family methyltransferase